MISFKKFAKKGGYVPVCVKSKVQISTERYSGWLDLVQDTTDSLTQQYIQNGSVHHLVSQRNRIYFLFQSFMN